MTDAELDDAEQTAVNCKDNDYGDMPDLCKEVIALVAEVRRLRARVADLEAQLAMERSR